MTFPPSVSSFGTTGEPLPLARSLELQRSASRLIPGLTQSQMKRPAAFAPGAFPVYLRRGQGAVVEDVDGTHYIDYIGGLGANLLGHNHPAVLAAIQAALPDGLLHSLPTALEVSVTEQLLDAIPGAEMGRFFKTGADATSAAVRLARYLTGKQRLITVGYNGWHDHFMYDTPGVPTVFAEYTKRLPLQHEQDETDLLANIEQQGPDLAAVLFAPPYLRPVSDTFLQQLQRCCRRAGTLLVLDEVVTGFRLARGGAQEYHKLQADLVCVSKGLAAGMPLSALVGPREHMESLAHVQVSTTFGGERLSLAACAAALDVYAQGTPTTTLAQLGQRLRAGVNQAAEQTGSELRVSGYDCIPFFCFSTDVAIHVQKMTRFVAAMARRGVLLRRDLNFLSFAHRPEHIEFTIEAARAALHELQTTDEH